MAERLSRKELYDLVWSEPMKTLSQRLGVSDVGLKKICARGAIPTPDRGYWAKKDAGKEAFHPPFPARPPGMDDQVLVGDTGHRSSDYYWGSRNEDLLAPIGPPPMYTEPIEEVRARISEKIGHVTVPHKVQNWHPTIDRLLKEDEKRREKHLNDPYPISWDKPNFETPFERRRLRILNSLFYAAGKMHGKTAIHGREAREIQISFFQQHVPLSLDRPKQSPRRGGIQKTSGESSDSRLSLCILKGWGSAASEYDWQDEDDQKLEARMTEIAVQVILTAEIQYRARALREYEWRVKRKAELEEEERQRKLEAERAERERQKRLEQGRVDRLLRDAVAFHQAGTIRKYVEAIRSTNTQDGFSKPEEFERWSRWALTQADRIDPVIGNRFLNAMKDEDKT